MRKKFTMLLASLFMAIGTVWAQASVEENGTVTDSWEGSSWTVVTENIPEGVAAVEKGEYSDAASSIGSASKTISLPAGSLRATLMYVTGNNRLDILGVDLLKEDGTTVVSSDYHFGFSGNQKVNNAYDLEIPEAGVYTIRYWVTFCKEANSSSGNITLQHYKLGIPVYSAAELSNEKVYTVTPADNANTGAWDVMADDSRLSITRFSGNAVNAASANQQFAFLTVNGETYLYNYGTKKFVENDGGQKLTDNLSSKCLIEFLVSTITSNQVIYPLVVKVGGNQLHSSYQNHLSDRGGIITTWEHTNSPGNAVAIVPVDGTVDLSAAIAKIEAYQISQIVVLKEALKTLLGEAKTLAGKSYINSEALNTAITEAQGVYDDATAAYTQVKEKKNALSAAIIAAGYVTQVEQFSNNGVYTFLSKRSDKAYMMYDAGTPDYVASQYMKTDLTVGSGEANCQWAVYKSANGYYYMYNLGAGKFMGTESAGNTSIPFSATPQTTGLKFAVSTVSTHPIMISSDNGAGAINHSNNVFDGKNKAGVITWAGGFGFKDDPGNVHQVAIVGELNEETLATIKTAVEAYEERGIAKQELDEYLAYFKGAYYDAWASTAYKWRDQEGVNNYTINADFEVLTLEEYYNKAKAVADAAESTAEKLIEAREVLEDWESYLVINQPEEGKFYRLRCVDGKKRLQSIVQADGDQKDRLTLADNTEATTIFLYDGNGLLSYTNGLYMDHRVFNTVGTSSAVIFSEAVNGNKGQYNILVGPNYIYGAGTTLDSGNGTPDNRDGYNWWLEEVTSLPVTVGDRLHATFFAPVAVTIPEGIQAYTGKVNGEWLTLTEVEGTIPAGTPVVLIAQEAKTYGFAIEESEAAAFKSDLRGTTPTIVNGKKDEEDKYYTLQSHGDNGVAFRPYIGANIGGFKAYLEIPAGTNAAALRIRFAGEEENTTGIEGIELGEELVIFDLAGRRVQKMEKGIYIVNGKKVVIK